MKHLLTISLCFLALSLSVYGQVPDYVPTEGLVAWYPFNGNANDESPYNNSAAVFGASLTEDRFGLTNSAYFFDGNDHIESPHQDWLNYGTGSTTWVGWGQKTGGNDHAHLLTKGVFTSAPYSAKGTYLRIAPDNFVEFGGGQGGAGYESIGYGAGCQTDEALEDWFHLVGIINKEEGFSSVYVNGELACIGPINYPEYNTDQDGLLLIGCEHPYVSLPSGPQYFIGRLDDLGIWNRALSEEEILSLYNAPPPNPGCTDITACNFDPMAEFDDGTCHYNCNFCMEGTIWNEETFGCVVENPTDTNLDGCTDLNDLMDILANYGDCAVSGFTCGDDIEHDGYDYSTVQIGDQCWFAENCRYLPEVSPSSASSTTDPYYYVYGYEGTDVEAAKTTSIYATYGVLYNWPAVMTEDICPSGWHIPTDAEWQTMEMSLGMSVAEAADWGFRGTDEGYQMKSTSGWNSNGNGSNSSGFTGLPGGYRFSGGFSGYGGGGNWWSASGSGNGSWRRVLLNDLDIVFRDMNGREYGFSARCVRD
jgi:uncharacterized protein (TIGR02145 family)